jgi:peptidoglycan/LPS O-acetylase OafA/YrhL
MAIGPLYKAYLAVDFFFMLSGFVIAYAYEARLLNGLRASLFMQARLVRLYPLYLFGSCITILVVGRQVFHGWLDARDFVLTTLFSFFFLPTPSAVAVGHRYLYPLNPPAWSLFFELAANAIYALIASRLTTRKLIILVVLAALTLIGFHLLRGGIIQGGGNSGWHYLISGALRVTFSFFGGVLIYRCWSITRFRIPIPALILLIALVLVLGLKPPEGFTDIYDFASIIVAFPLIVYAAASANPSNPVLRGVYINLGLASYAVYAIHWPLYDLVNHVRIRLAGDASILNPVWGLIFVSSILCVGLGLSRYYDLPTRRMMTTILSRRSEKGPKNLAKIASELPAPSVSVKRIPFQWAPKPSVLNAPPSGLSRFNDLGARKSTETGA